MAFSEILKPEMLKLILFIIIFIVLDVYIAPPYRHEEVLNGNYYSCTENTDGGFECVRIAEVPLPLGVSFGLSDPAADLFWSYIWRVLAMFVAYFVSSIIVWGLSRVMWAGVS
jgi:hypothetical protein